MSGNLNPNFKPVLSVQTPTEDYKHLIEQYVEAKTVIGNELRNENYKKIASSAREATWKLLFVEKQTIQENEKKAADLLKQHKMDACFYNPWEYNEWVVTLRDELLKNNKLDFWRNEVVKYELGPCWSRDSDYFDDPESETPEMEAYYAHAGCVAPFSKSGVDNRAPDQQQSEKPEMEPCCAHAGSVAPFTESEAGSQAPDQQQNVSATNFQAIISLQNPLKDYTKLMNEHVLMDYIVSDEALAESFSKISAAARNTVWKLLFSEQPPSQQNLNKAAELLQKHRSDACFHYPWDYNDWIVTLRDELLKRKMFDFWREQIVKKELGLIWARNSDYFDDLEDPAPAAFYKYAGCVAPFSVES